MAIVLYTIAYIGDIVNTILLSERAREPADFDMLILLICFVDYRHKLLLCEGLAGGVGPFRSRFYLFNSESIEQIYLVQCVSIRSNLVMFTFRPPVKSVETGAAI